MRETAEVQINVMGDLLEEERGGGGEQEREYRRWSEEKREKEEGGTSGKIKCVNSNLVFVDETCNVQTQCWNGTEYSYLSPEGGRGYAHAMDCDPDWENDSIRMRLV